MTSLCFSRLGDKKIQSPTVITANMPNMQIFGIVYADDIGNEGGIDGKTHYLLSTAA